MSERRAAAEGRLRRHARFASRFLQSRRDLIVYLPPGYGAANARYPVLYLQDGQNLFDPATAFGGQDWRVDLTADDMITNGSIEPLIIVGIYNTGVRRIGEYTPTRSRKLRKGGKADRYAEMLVREIKPFIDHEYLTLKSAAYSSVGGSSLGALVSLTTILEYPRVFGSAALLSPSVWWDDRVILRIVRDHVSKARQKIWLDTGSAEGENPEGNLADVRQLRDELVRKGWRENENLCYREVEQGTHSEAAWAFRFGDVLAFLFGAPRVIE